MSNDKEMVIVSETHWDREWYLPFQEYRARLVILVDKLLKILDSDPKFSNFTFDGQTIVLEDYLEVKPENKTLLKKYITEGRISVGPWYVLPDEFLVSGEAIIRNLMLGHKIAREFGRVMRAGYIPDPFGHIAQLPQIMQGFEIDSIIFMRGMDDSEENLNLNLEFNWHSPGRIASVLAVHLRYGYGSVAELPTNKTGNIYKAALKRIQKVQQKLLRKSAASVLLLNNGSDHTEVQGELPEITENWNNSSELNEYKLIQNDFEYYIEKLKRQQLNLKEYEGEFRGARHHPILSGVFSARMWIKQCNTECQYLLENWAEPLAAFTWILGNSYPQNYIWAGWKWLLRNHPHDSICGCSIDEVHRDMHTRFVWAKQIAEEVIKDSMYMIYKRIQTDDSIKDKIPLMIFNALPWTRTDLVSIDITLPSVEPKELKFQYKLINSSNQGIPFQLSPIIEKPRLQTPKAKTYRLSFLAKEIPACGYELFYLQPCDVHPNDEVNGKSTEIENEYYKVIIHENGTLTITDKELDVVFDKVGIIEDVGDWGDEYDYSPPHDLEVDQRITNEKIDADIQILETGPTKRTVQISYSLKVPESLSQDRNIRSKSIKELPVKLNVSLYPKIKRIDLKVSVDNQCKDHRLRILFPTGIQADRVTADGHFTVVERLIDLPKGEKWKQPPSKTNHQLKYVSVKDNQIGFTVCNIGLPEYEAIREINGSITFAITLLRCVGWLALPFLVTRKEIAGPALATPESQNIGQFVCELSITTHKPDFPDSNNNKIAQEFNIPLKAFNPAVMRTALRIPDHIFFRGIPLLLSPDEVEEKSLATKYSFLELTPNHLILSACKKAENDLALIIRVYNLSRFACKGTIKLFHAIEKVKTVNLDEKEVEDTQISDIQIDKNQLNFQILGLKIATFKILLK
ncbi:MAG TPA: glycoside hydrolase family 38 C-terminal domain-containing protein [Candidatus Deferrimicrobium sp.]|nr:glycoside hydrolase family 38 C-terminal domain-containing protein [Candidatus Deferrimicrobium sp.]